MGNKTLRELAQILYGKSPNEIRAEESPFPIWGTGGRIGSAQRPLFSGPIIILPRKGTLTNPSYCETNCWVIDTAYAAIAQQNVDPKWLFYNLSLANLESLNEATGVPSINRDMLYRLEFYALSLEEQRNIAEILTTVDNLIEQTEAAIAKYQSIKQGMMHDLFTRGVDANGHLRPPRQEAPELYKESELGWIPKEWEVATLSESTNSLITYGIVQAGPHIDNGVPYIRTGDMSGDSLIRGNMLCTTTHISESYKRSTVANGDIVCAIRATVGKVLLVPKELEGANLTQGTAKISPKRELNNIFILYLLRSYHFKNQVTNKIKGTTFNEITLEDLRSIFLPIPIESNERNCISDILESIQQKEGRERFLLNKYQAIKSGLMQDLLSGRVRVPTADAATTQEPPHAA